MDFTKNFKEFLLEHNTQHPAVAIARNLFMVATEQERRPVGYERVRRRGRLDIVMNKVDINTRSWVGRSLQMAITRLN
jgi:hypothetical protein